MLTKAVLDAVSIHAVRVWPILLGIHKDERIILRDSAGIDMLCSDAVFILRPLATMLDSNKARRAGKGKRTTYPFMINTQTQLQSRGGYSPVQLHEQQQVAAWLIWARNRLYVITNSQHFAQPPATADG